jgi:hypothetical protein
VAAYGRNGLDGQRYKSGNDDERGLLSVYEDLLVQLLPHEPVSLYLHNRTDEDNTDALLKRQTSAEDLNR